MVQDKKTYISLEKILRKAISDDYSSDILKGIYSDVVEDIEVSADEDFNEDDVRLAFGRVILDRLTNSRVYKVSDDEWEDIMGSEQLRSFALDQMIEKINASDDEEIEEDIDSYVDDNYKDKVREVLKLYSDDIDVEEQLTDELAIEILKLRYFDVEKLNIK